MWQLCGACFASLPSDCERTVNAIAIRLVADAMINSTTQIKHKLSKTGLMELLEHLRRQFAYDAWANREVLAGLKMTVKMTELKMTELKMSDRPSPRPLQLLAHILSAERLWLERILQQPQSLPVWPDFTLEQCETQIADLAQRWQEYLCQLSTAALADKVAYKNSRGEPWASTVEDVLTHVTLHSAYHRGQIASQLRAGGETPAYTDYIHAIRQDLIE